jgi:H+/Cl- antiporter ClcA
MVEEAMVFTAWLFALLAGAISGLGVFQALTGHRTHFFAPRSIDWSEGEVKLFGLAGAIYTLSLAVYVLVSSLAFESNRLTWPVSLTVLPLLAVWWVFQGLMRQRHNRRWPFKAQLNPS